MRRHGRAEQYVRNNLKDGLEEIALKITMKTFLFKGESAKTSIPRRR